MHVCGIVQAAWCNRALSGASAVTSELCALSRTRSVLGWRNRLRSSLSFFVLFGAIGPPFAASDGTAQFANAQPAEAAGGTESVYKDIYLKKRGDEIIFGNQRISIEIDARDGSWTGLFSPGIPGGLIASSKTAGVDFRVDNIWVVATRGEHFKGYHVSIDAGSGRVSLTTTFDVASRSSAELVPPKWKAQAPIQAPPGPTEYDYELTSTYTLLPATAYLGRTASVLRRQDGNILGNTSRQMQGFLFELPGVTIGPEEDSVVENVGPVVPDSHVPPRTNYASQRNRFTDVGNAPDDTFGLVAFYNAKLLRSVSTWMDTEGKVGYETYLAGDGRRISVLHHDLKATWIRAGQTVNSESDELWIEDGNLANSFLHYRKMLAKDSPLNQATPHWARGMVILEVMPSLFPNGIAGLTAKLPFYRSVGFNTIYLMPHWLGGYSPIDPFVVDPAVGTEKQLKDMVQSAHALGMRVIFDMVIHGFNQRSPIVGEHPEFFQRDLHGLLTGQYDWGSVATDPAASAYQKYMADLALHDIRTYGIDGYRVDANSFRSPDWDPSVRYQPWQSAAGSVPLLTNMYRAMRKEKPDTVLLSEVFGPVWYKVCNLVHDDMTMGPQYLLELMDRGEFTPALYKQQLADENNALLPDANRVYFSRNHDTSWFYHFNGYSPRFLAMDAVHSFVGIPEVFAGDPDHGPSPDSDPAVFSFYRRIFAAREKFPELATGEVMLDEIQTTNPWVFSGLRKGMGHLSMFAVSFSGGEETVDLRIDANILDRNRDSQNISEIIAYDPISGKKWRVACHKDDGSLMVTLKLSAYQIVLARLGS